MNMDTCAQCSGSLEPKKVDLVHRWGDKLYLIRGVPALVCQDCGEEYFDAHVLRRIDEMRETIEKSGERVEIPSGQYSERDIAA